MTTNEKTSAGTAWNVISGWLMDQPASAVRVNNKGVVRGSHGHKAAAGIYAMNVGRGRVIWDSTKTCAKGVCSTSAYSTVGTKFKTVTDIRGVTSAITNNTVQIGLKPVFLQ